MRFGKEYQIDKVGPDNLEAFAADIGVKPTVVKSRLSTLLENAPDAWEQLQALPETADTARVMERIWDGWRMRALNVNRR